MTAAERQYEEAIQKIDLWAQKHPEFHDNNLFQNLVARAQKGDVAAANKLKQFQHWANVKKSHVQKFVELNTARVNKQIALERYQAAQNAQAAEAQRVEHGKRFDAWLQQAHPQYVEGENNRALKKAARAILKERGFSDQQIKGLAVSLSAVEQSILAESAMMRLERERARDATKELQRRGVPTVEQYRTLRPGGVTIGPRGGGTDAAAQIKKLQGQLSGAKGHRAIVLATELQKLKRGQD
jgi:hypothetical protein